MTLALKITVNGEPKEVEPGTTVERFVADQGLPRERVAVERNREIVRRVDWADTSLEAGDVLEVVHFVGGG